MIFILNPGLKGEFILAKICQKLVARCKQQRFMKRGIKAIGERNNLILNQIAELLEWQLE